MADQHIPFDPEADADRRRMAPMRAYHDARRLTRFWEDELGFDSIYTIERVYEQAETGAYVCPWPDCGFRRHGARDMWNHVHFARKHHGG